MFLHKKKQLWQFINLPIIQDYYFLYEIYKAYQKVEHIYIKLAFCEF